MDEGTIGRNASAMRENVSHILTKVIIIIIIINIIIISIINTTIKKGKNLWTL